MALGGKRRKQGAHKERGKQTGPAEGAGDSTDAGVPSNYDLPPVKGSISAEEAEKLFSTVDETGHTNEETARRERSRRSQGAQGVDVDPLSGKDPSGSNVGEVMSRTTTVLLLVFFLAVLGLQVSCGVARRASTESLADEANVSTVAAAMNNGVEWGNGFTQFPEDFSVQEADENTHRIEVSVTDTSSSDALGVFSSSQIQAAALSVNALLNPDINTVVYNVNVHVNKSGKIQTSQFFGYLKPTGELKTLMTFIWTKTTTAQGVRFNCSITGVDADTEEQLRGSITNGIIDNVLGTGDGTGDDTSVSVTNTDGVTTLINSLTGGNGTGASNGANGDGDGDANDDGEGASANGAAGTGGSTGVNGTAGTGGATGTSNGNAAGATGTGANSGNGARANAATGNR